MRSVAVIHDRVQVDTGAVSRTKQSFKDECDINVILTRFAKTGVVENLKSGGRFVDVSGFDGDYQRALEVVRSAREAFLRLPAAARSRFDNDPAAFVEFAQDPANYDEMVAMGLFSPREGESDEPGLFDQGEDAGSDEAGEGA